jgi:hypothetical protein
VEPAPHPTLIGFGAMPVNGLTMNKDSLEQLPFTDSYAMAATCMTRWSITAASTGTGSA